MTTHEATNKYNVLLIGSGGREHAFAWKLRQSHKVNNLYITPGNAGTMALGENVELEIQNINILKSFILSHQINMVIVGPEQPLVDGIHDLFLEDNVLKDIPVIGPVREGAKLEGSKDFAKEFMLKYNIPTAKFRTFNISAMDEGMNYLESTKPPFVLKADGLAAGKGVLICDTLEMAKTQLGDMLKHRKFGNASDKVVIEDFLKGFELSVFVITDGLSYKILPEAKDYKRIGERDTGPNTGGMGSVSPVPFVDKNFMNKIENRIIKPTIDGLNKEGIRYQGFIFFGLIKVGDDPYVIEYNVRMGDPEAESIIPRIKSDIMELFEGVAQKKLHEKVLEIDPLATATVFLVSGGYPEDYQKNKVISGLEDIHDSLVFHAGTKQDEKSGQVLTNGGRVIAICSHGSTIAEALYKSYGSAEIIDFEGKYYRSDIGRDIE